MRLLRRLAPPLLVLLAVGLVAPAGAAPPPSAAPSVASPSARTTPLLRVFGAVSTHRGLTLADLQALPQQSQTVSYSAAGKPVTATFTGPLLTDVLATAGLRTDPAVKNDSLRFAVLAKAADGYQAVVSDGEIDPGFGATPALVALTQDGQPLARPRLTVPGDVKGGRYVSDLAGLRVYDLGR